MKKFLRLQFAFFMIMSVGLCSTAAAQKSINFKTYYPEPAASFDRIRLNAQESLPATTCAPGEFTLLENLTSSDLTTKDVLYTCYQGAPNQWGLNKGVWSYTTSAGYYDVFLTACADFNEECPFKVGIGTNQPLFKLTLENDGSILSTGISQDDGYPIALDGLQFAWIPETASFSATKAGGEECSLDDVQTWSFSHPSPPTHTSSASMSGTWIAPSTDFTLAHYSVSLGSGTGAPFKGEVKIGYCHPSTSLYGTRLGGAFNHIWGQYSVIGGGTTHSLQSNYSLIGGGEKNYINLESHFSLILGGRDNLLKSFGSVIGSGKNNWILNDNLSSQYNIILGGEESGIFMETSYSVIGGGRQNIIRGRTDGHNTIIGGNDNGMSYSGVSLTGPSYSTIIGGNNNIIVTSFATIGGGAENSLNQEFGTIIGGQSHEMRFDPQADPETSRYGTIVGGNDHELTGGSFIGGGQKNLLRRNADAGQTAVILGGDQNRCSAGCFIGGGKNNAVGRSDVWTNFNNASLYTTGTRSTILGGEGNLVTETRTWAGGKNMSINGANAFVWGHNDTLLNSARGIPAGGGSSLSFIIRTGRVGIQTLSPQYTLDINGDMRVTSRTFLSGVPSNAIGPSSAAVLIDGNKNFSYDVAEVFTISGPAPEPGDVMIIDPEHAPAITHSRQPYDQAVVGIISTSPAITLEGPRMIIGQYPQEEAADQKKLAVALKGRVPVKVSLENGPISIGDILTTSSVPGHAMKASSDTAGFGTILGKALEPFTGGPNGETTGKIITFVTVH